MNETIYPRILPRARLHTSMEAFQRQTAERIAVHDAEVQRHETIIRNITEVHDEEIRKHKHAIADLRRGLNSLLSIARLPDELLAEIFMIYAAVFKADLADSQRAAGHTATRYLLQHPTVIRRTESQYAWIRVTHICHRWREVALGFPRLWTHIDCRRPDMTAEWLLRSKAAPLHVSSVLEYGRAAWIRGCDSLLLALQELPRTRHLEIRTPRFNQTYKGFEAAWAPCPSTMLESIELTTITNWYSEHGGTPIIKRLLNGNPIRLENLILNDTYLHWSDIKHPALASLKRFTHISGSWVDSLEDMLKVLAECVSLEELDLSDAQHDMSLPLTTQPMTDNNLPQVELANLRQIRLGSTPYLSLALIDRLKFPSSASVELNFSRGGPTIPEHGDLIAASLGKYFGAERGKPLTTFSLEGYDCRIINLKGWWGSRSEPPERSSQADIAVTFDLYEVPHPYLHWRTILETILSGIPLPSVRTLFLSEMRRYVFLTDLRRALRQMTGVHTIHISGWTSRELLRLLYTRRRPHAEDVFMPHLRTLYLHSISFPPHPRQEADAAELELLVDRLLSRKAHGAPLDRLVLQDCYNLTDADIVPFKENVKDLRWDGRTDPGDTFLWDDPEPDDFEEDDADWDAVIQLNDDF